MIDWIEVQLEIDGEIVTIAGRPYKIKFYDKKKLDMVKTKLRKELN